MDIPLYINTRTINIDSLTNPKWFKKELDSDAFYSSIQDIFASFGPPYGAADNKIIPNGFFWSSLAVNVLLRSREYSDEPTQNQCSNKEDEITQYSYLHTETVMLMLGIMVLSWLKVNLKKKTENGYRPILFIVQQRLINPQTVQLEVIFTGTYTWILHQY